MNLYHPESMLELIDMLCAEGTWTVRGTKTKAAWVAPMASRTICLGGLSGIIEHDVEDHVVRCQAGTKIEELQAELRRTGQCLPIEQFPSHESLLAGLPGTIGGTLSTNLPHSLEHQHGSWRDWVIGLTAVRPDGTVVRLGSKAVKNVAGYDAHKLFVGARSTIGVIAEVTLRTFPIGALKQSRLVRGIAGDMNGAKSIVRVSRSMAEAFWEEHEGLGIAWDTVSSTFWLNGFVEAPGGRGWSIHSDLVTGPISPPLSGLMKRIISQFDPESRLARGEFGWHRTS